jgi:4-hydroxy-tetrahydrodipicolinate synthase
VFAENDEDYTPTPAVSRAIVVHNASRPAATNGSNEADGIVVTGTTGETSTLTDAEKIKLVEVAKAVAGTRAKIIMGGPSNETAHAIKLAHESAKAGADAIMAVTPYYNKPTQAGVLTHFRMIADATDLPMIVYDIPGRAGIPVHYETILRLSHHPNIRAIKDAKGDFAEVSRVLNQTDLIYFSGDDANVLPHDGAALDRVLDAVREITRRHGVLLVIDETHTLCAGPGGATRAWAGRSRWP